jgi:hypothetical protein
MNLIELVVQDNPNSYYGSFLFYIATVVLVIDAQAIDAKH